MSMGARRKALLVVATAGMMVFGSLAQVGAAEPQGRTLTATQLDPSGTVTGSKSVSGRLAKTDAELLARTDATPVNVMIKLDYDATASYAGGIKGLAATSPRVTGKKLTGKSSAERAYASYVSDLEAAFISALRKAVPTAEIGQSFRTVYGGISAVIPARSVKTVLAIDDAAAVQADALNQPLTDSSPSFINATDVYASLGTTTDAGAGLIFGDLDTGVWPEHPSFADQGNLPAPPAKADGTARVCDFGDNPLTPEADVFVCNDKLIGGQPFLDTYLSSPSRAAAEPFHTARDSNGHGTHTSSTSAGNVVESAPVFGVDRGPIHGVAPGAHIIEYKVCGIQGCYSSDSAAAVEQAILDGVDVINFSISGGTNPYSDPVELAFLDAYAAGVFVSTSAGNSGPAAGTANHVSPWVMTVAASTQTREFATTLTLHADGDATFSADGASITDGIGELPVVLSSAAPYGRALCDAPAAPGTFTGKIVACQRGVNARVDKGYNVLQGGAAAMILYNPTLADVETDNHWLPAVHLADGTDFVAFMNAHTGVTGSFAAGDAREGQGDVMAAFSSRGPAGLFIKPDVTAPGVQILAGHTPVPESITEGPPGEYFQAIAGTSMSAPHVAGAALLVMAAHPSWTPGQVKSALMTSALTEVVKEDLSTPADPFDDGAGRIDVGAAAASALTLDESPIDYFAMSGDPLAAIHLNVPSINAPVMPGRISTTRTFTNSGSAKVKVDVSAESPAGSTISVSPTKLNLNPGASGTVTVTITSDAPLGVQQFGTVLLSGGGQSLHLPVAFIHTQGKVALSQDCGATELTQGQETTCDVSATNLSFDEQTVSLDSTTDNSLVVTAADGATLSNSHLVQRHGVTLAGAELGIPAVDPGGVYGYIGLAGFGIAPTPIGDEAIINYNVPAFVYGGVTYSRIGIDSNGYIVVGGGSAVDNECCNLPAGPDPARPNNMLAPFWTDLDGTGAPGIRVATLSDGVNSWLIVEYDVYVWGTTSARTFQVWIGIDGVEDITYAYDPAQLPADPGQLFLVGAENANGEGDMEAVLPTEDLRVTSSDPTPGDTVSYSFTVKGTSRGAGLVKTEMVATGVSGVTIEKDTITVKK
jgi:hypothetical protein